MPTQNGQYKAPMWKNNSPPSLDETELNAMSGGIERSDQPVRDVGDIIFTSRTDLGDRYLLCNGDIVTDSKYDKLKDILPYITPNNNIWKIVAGASGVYCASGNGWTVSVSGVNIFYTDGKSGMKLITSQYNCFGIVFDGERFSVATVNLSTYYLYILYFSFPTGSIEVSQGTHIGSSYSSSYRYYGGMYLFLQDGKIFYTSDILQQFSSAIVADNKNISGICYTNGYYIASAVNSNTLYYSSNLSSWAIGARYGVLGSVTYGWYDGTYHMVIWNMGSSPISTIFEFSSISSSAYISSKKLSDDIRGGYFGGTEKDDVVAYINLNSRAVYFLKSDIKSVPNNSVIYVHNIVFEGNTDKFSGISMYDGSLTVCGTDISSALGSCPIGEKVLPIVDGGQSYPMIKGY